MRNVSVMFEVSEEVYDNIVTPFKKSKMLGKLMASLLTGYLEEEDIREYIDEEIEGMHKASVDTVSEIFENMQESLAAMGIFANEAKSTNDRGRKYFKKQAEGINVEKSPETGINSEEFKTVQSDIADIKQQMSELKEFLVALSKNGIKVEESDKEDEMEEIEEDEIEENAPTEEEKHAASSIISGLLSGNSITF